LLSARTKLHREIITCFAFGNAPSCVLPSGKPSHCAIPIWGTVVDNINSALTAWHPPQLRIRKRDTYLWVRRANLVVLRFACTASSTNILTAFKVVVSTFIGEVTGIHPSFFATAKRHKTPARRSIDSPSIRSRKSLVFLHAKCRHADDGFYIPGIMRQTSGFRIRH
jgi:hypothetical protein